MDSGQLNFVPQLASKHWKVLNADVYFPQVDFATDVLMIELYNSAVTPDEERSADPRADPASGINCSVDLSMGAYLSSRVPVSIKIIGLYGTGTLLFFIRKRKTRRWKTGLSKNLCTCWNLLMNLSQHMLYWRN